MRLDHIVVLTVHLGEFGFADRIDADKYRAIFAKIIRYSAILEVLFETLLQWTEARRTSDEVYHVHLAHLHFLS